jgi:hypothetical protein
MILLIAISRSEYEYCRIYQLVGLFAFRQAMQIFPS